MGGGAARGRLCECGRLGRRGWRGRRGRREARWRDLRRGFDVRAGGRGSALAAGAADEHAEHRVALYFAGNPSTAPAGTPTLLARTTDGARNWADVTPHAAA